MYFMFEFEIIFERILYFMSKQKNKIHVLQMKCRKLKLASNGTVTCMT